MARRSPTASSSRCAWPSGAGWTADLAGRLRALLARLGLPPLPPLDPAELVSHMARDKKAREGGLVWVLPARSGEGKMISGVPWEEVSAELVELLRDPFTSLSSERSWMV